MRVIAIMKRIFRQFRRDRRSLAMMFIAPIFILTLLWLVLDADEYVPEMAVVDVPHEWIESFQQSGANVVQMSLDEAEKALIDKKIDAYVIRDHDRWVVMLEGSDPVANRSVQQVLQSSMVGFNIANFEMDSEIIGNQSEMLEMLPEMVGIESSAGLNPVNEIEVAFLHGSEEMSLFDRIGPVLIGLFVFFFIFLLGGVSFLRERTQGTLDRLLATPLRRWQLVAGYLCGFSVFTIVQSVLIVTFCIYGLGMVNAGSMFHVMLVTFLLAMTALSLGTMLSAFAKNEFQMIQWIPVVIVPQVFFSGVFHLETMEPWLRNIGTVMPLTYAAEALQEIMIRGQGLSAIQFQLYILLGFSLLFICLNVLALKKHRAL